MPLANRYSDLDFLKRLILFFKIPANQVHRSELTRLLGYLRHLQDESPGFSMQGWTLNSLQRRADQWYAEIAERQAFIPSRIVVNGHWIGAPLRPFLLEQDGITYSIQAINFLQGIA